MTEKAAESDSGPVKLTPTQRLILDQLGARERLGENLWHLEAAHARSITRLSSLGLVSDWGHGAPGSIRVSLTDAGRKLTFSDTYQSPLEKELAEARADLEAALRVGRLAGRG